VEALVRDESGSITALRELKTEPEPLPLVVASRGGEIVIGRAIGEGGNALVCAAKQASLDREVAVKKPRGATTAMMARALIQEGLVLGALEHPNIVPVHLLGRDEQGQPLIVLKRVEGTEWSDYVGGCEPLDAPDESADPLAGVESRRADRSVQRGAFRAWSWRRAP
jgi:serine/threonine-protein kinase